VVAKGDLPGKLLAVIGPVGAGKVNIPEYMSENVFVQSFRNR
jgi:ABC-type hemin transport system ATPase subunit